MAKLSPSVIDKLSLMICGEPAYGANFYYRGKKALQKFFRAIDITYEEKPLSRENWTIEVLEHLNVETNTELPSNGIIDAIEELLSPVYYSNDAKKHDLAIDELNVLLKPQHLEVKKDISTNNVKLYSALGNYISTSKAINSPSEIITFSPSVFEVPQGSTVKNCVSVMMPFSKEFEDVYLAIKKACDSEGMSFHRADDFWKNSVIIQDIFELICRSSIVIVDFSNKNENVFYEAGIAHTLGKHVIPLTQSIDSIPFDLRHHRHIVYLNNGEGLRKLEEKLVERLASLKE